jgi:hypothetical protein
MTFKPAIWYPIAAALSIINLVSVALTAGSGQVWHPALHAALALAFGVWAERLRRGRGASELQGPGGSELEARFEALDAEVSKLRQELSETQERLDFAERLLAQGRETRRMGPER